MLEMMLVHAFMMYPCRAVAPELAFSLVRAARTLIHFAADEKLLGRKLRQVVRQTLKIYPCPKAVTANEPPVLCYCMKMLENIYNIQSLTAFLILDFDRLAVRKRLALI